MTNWMRTLSSKLPGRKGQGRRIRGASLVDRLMNEFSGPLCFVPESRAARYGSDGVPCSCRGAEASSV